MINSGYSLIQEFDMGAGSKQTGDFPVIKIA